MRDMKANFTLANPSLTGLDWPFMPEIFRETQLSDGLVFDNCEKGEVVGGVRVAKENVVAIEELEATTKPRVTEQIDTRADPLSE